MPTWGELLQELQGVQAQLNEQAAQLAPGTRIPSPHDLVRRKYLRSLADQTGRTAIVYATAWMENRPGMPPDVLAIQLGDQQGLMEACSNTTESRQLDLLLHSPGGSAEAAEAMMAYLRTQFDHIRAVVPLAAMSAATMMALACDEIVMGDHSQLGPIDPQFTISTPEGPRSAPAQAIEDQFERAKLECRTPENIAAWLPILRGYAPGLLAMCDHQRALAQDFAAKALAAHMFSGETNGDAEAQRVAEWFSDFTAFRSHGRRVGRDEAVAQGLKIVPLEDDPQFQDAVLSVHHAVQHTFTGTLSAKLVENHLGRAWIRMAGEQSVQIVAAPVPPGASGAGGPGGPTPVPIPLAPAAVPAPPVGPLLAPPTTNPAQPPVDHSPPVPPPRLGKGGEEPEGGSIGGEGRAGE